MGTVSEKLSYLLQTKELFKNKLNDLGAGITNNTTFRNYTTWLSTLYESTSNKTDLSINGVVGRTTQELEPLPTPSSEQQITNLTGNVVYTITTQDDEQTFTIPLGNIELCENGEYKDKIYFNNGKFYLEKIIGKLVLNGTETGVRASSAGNLYSFAITQYNTVINKTNVNNVKSNMLATSSTRAPYVVYVATSGSISITVLPEDVSSYDYNSFKTYIQNLYNNNTPIILYIVLATAETTEITEQNYPQLYNVLKQIQDYLTSYKINKEFVLNYNSPEIEY